jgi:IS5 family transposase
MAQRTFADYEMAVNKKTWRDDRLDLMESIVPWDDFVQVIQPYYPKSSGGPGRPSYPLMTMLRIYLLQIWFNLSDPAMEADLINIPCFRYFVNKHNDEILIPDETTILNFRHLIERHDLAKKIFCAVNAYLRTRGSRATGSVIDSTIISAATSIKNSTKSRDPEMKHTKKGQQYYFGMKAHIGVDSEDGTVHSVVCTGANEADINQADNLLDGNETVVYGDAGYRGIERRTTHVGVQFEIAMRPGKRKLLAKDSKEYLEERRKSSVRAKVEHVFCVIKRVFGFVKTRYRGLRKNTDLLYVLCAFANIWLFRKKLTA